MACLVDKRIINRKYIKIAHENNEPVDNYSNREDYYVHVPCGRCINCVKSYMTQWRIRILHEFQYMTPAQRDNSYFITLTFNDDHLSAIYNAYKKCMDLKFVLGKVQRLFFDRIRKKYGKTTRHWLVTEYGERTKRLHLHGMLFDVNFPILVLPNLWRYGYVNYAKLNEKRIGYCTKYITKYADDLLIKKRYRQYVFSSPGLGSAFTKDPATLRYHHPSPGVVSPLALNASGIPYALPRYYRTKIFDDFEREELTLAYFREQSEDVIPDGPYRVGKIVYTDYLQYLDKCEEVKQRYKFLKKSKQL